MKTFLFTSTQFTGHIYFQFDDAGRLMKYDTTDAVLTSQQKDWITGRLPKTLADLQIVLKKSKGAKLTEQKILGWTFEKFWPMAYINKGSSKKLSLKLWEKMPQAQRDKAANYWPLYLRNKNDGEGIKYVETYLRSEIWNN